MTEPKIGDFFVSSSGFGGSLWSKLLAKFVQWGTDSAVNHAGVYVGGEKVVVEAQPGGVRYAPLSMYQNENTIWANGIFLLSDTEGQEVADHAVAMLGVPYGILDIIAIAIAQPRFEKLFGDKIDNHKPWDDQPWWVKRLARKDRLICSQLVDEAYRLANIHLYNDGRLSQLVSPGDLHRLILEHSFNK